MQGSSSVYYLGRVTSRDNTYTNRFSGQCVCENVSLGDLPSCVCAVLCCNWSRTTIIHIH
jgi:hypothetical protein